MSRLVLHYMHYKFDYIKLFIKINDLMCIFILYSGWVFHLKMNICSAAPDTLRKIITVESKDVQRENITD